MPSFTLTITDNDGIAATRTVQITSQEWPFVEQWATTYFPDREEVNELPVAMRWHLINIIQGWVEG